MSDAVTSSIGDKPHVAAGANYKSAKDGTLYWTLSLYLAADKVKSYLPAAESGKDTTGLFRKAQLQHYPSYALRNAIDPLFNDIADRERLGQAQDFLLAAGLEGWEPSASSTNPLDEAAAAVRASTIRLQVSLPGQFSWMTEGEIFTCRLAAAEDPVFVREMELRRFWFAHSDGALSYHLSFSHYYGNQHNPETYYFLSLLQKLAIPKEFSLSAERLQELIHRTNKADANLAPFSVFDSNLGIDPLDKITVKDVTAGAPERFWPYIKKLFGDDADILFTEVLGGPHGIAAAALLDTTLVDVIEVPGLRIPRSRSLFHIQDERFLKRLLPVDRDTGLPLPRKNMVQELCYRPYQRMFAKERKYSSPVVIGEGAKFLHWDWLRTRSDYQEALADGWFCSDKKGLHPITEDSALEKALHSGECWQIKDIDEDDKVFTLPTPMRRHIPAYEKGRTDCIDYLFLAGFNQNIIDWLNQDTSEILDSTDPIYPTEDSQLDEAFFVRFANHRALLTYVARSRSLEVGNDYIGTCPYAFLIHILAMHNEFLARIHEERAAKDIETIRSDLKSNAPDFKKIEQRINELKAANYEIFETHRYLNVFRYDTERDVFAKLEQLRGIDRRNAAVIEAIGSFEDKSYDMENRHNEAQQALDAARRAVEEKRNKTLNYVGLVIGWVSAVGVLFNASDYLLNDLICATEQAGFNRCDVGKLLGELALILAIPGVLGVFGFFVFWAFGFAGSHSTQNEDQGSVSRARKKQTRRTSK